MGAAIKALKLRISKIDPSGKPAPRAAQRAAQQ
jgi:hypothetical protein